MSKLRASREQRAPAIVEADDPIRARWRELDWFATPAWASRAGAALVKQIDPRAKSAWEPACGDGIMALPLLEFFQHVAASDIEPQGYGSTFDFVNGPLPPPFDVDWIITNPPFKYAQDFVLRGLTVARRGVAVLCRLAFLESVDRYALHFVGEHKLSYLCPFTERVPMQLGPWNPACSTATAYAWFIYFKHTDTRDVRILPIPPGTRDAYSRDDDVHRFVKPAPMPLFDVAG